MLSRMGFLMISLDSWSVKSPETIAAESGGLRYTCSYLGEELSLDDRVAWIDSYLDVVSRNKVTVNFDNETAELNFSGGDSISVADISDLPVPEGRILFDATSLSLPELVYLMEWAKITSKDFDVIYVEPSAYSAQRYKSKIGIQSIDYSLSEDGPGLCMLPRFTYPIDEGHLVVALGYEGHRFGALLISDEITPTGMTGMLGVPPFVLGWERNTYSKNYAQMLDARKQYDAEFKVVSANDPLQNYDVLNTVDRSFRALSRRGRRAMHLAPIGTKPVAIAMAWYAINNKGTGILYDFIRKKSKRSKGVGKVHFWRYSCSRDFSGLRQISVEECAALSAAE